MSKGIAIEQILYIFLMVVVILVASSFLLKALGIDIFGMISRLFEFKPQQPGKILHIKIDPGDPTVEIWEFHLSDDRKHLSEGNTFFWIKDEEFEEDKCIIFTTDEEGAWLGNPPDKGFIYYVKIGTIIQDGCGDNLYQCVNDDIANDPTVPNGLAAWCNRTAADFEGCDKNKCVTEPCDVYGCVVLPQCAGRYNYVGCNTPYYPSPEAIVAVYDFPPCDSRGTEGTEIEREKFSYEAKMADPCKNNPTICNILLIPEKDKISYIIKYGLICDFQTKRWKPCTKEGDAASGKDNRKYVCKDCDGIFRWVNEAVGSCENPDPT